MVKKTLKFKNIKNQLFHREASVFDKPWHKSCPNPKLEQVHSSGNKHKLKVLTKNPNLSCFPLKYNPPKWVLNLALRNFKRAATFELLSNPSVHFLTNGISFALLGASNIAKASYKNGLVDGLISVKAKQEKLLSLSRLW